MSNTKEKDMPFLIILFGLLPVPSRRSKMAKVSAYDQYYYALQKKVEEWLKNKLEKIDRGYVEMRDSRKLIRARQMALNQDIGPLDSRYPDIPD